MNKYFKILLALAAIFLLAGFFYWKLNFNKGNLKEVETSAKEQAVNQQSSISQQAKYQFFYDKAKEGIEQKNEKLINFWLTRYLSLAYNNRQINDAMDNLVPLFDEYKISPTSFLSGKYDPEFISWFINSSYELWDFNEANQELDMNPDITFQLAGVKDNKNIAVVFGSYPRLEEWSIINLPNSGTQTAILTLGNTDEKLYLHAGETTEGSDQETKSYGKIEIDLGENPLQYIWQPKFYDLDNDNIPEIWIRYNQATADGFIQQLVIYKIKNNNELYLFKKFTGKAEGIARRINGNQVEVGEGVSGKNGEGHLSFSKFRLETWEYKNGIFRKIAEKIIPHILLSNSWLDYYAD